MREKILHKASELFITLGVKSVTMDDLAERMAISKKTIYDFYANKYELIKATTDFLFEKIMNQINSICVSESNSPIHNLFEINTFICNQLNEDNNTEYQLQKYYPEVYESLHVKKLGAVTEGITENIERGIKMGLYRKDIDIPTLARFYYNGTNTLKDQTIFPKEQYKISQLMHTFLIYHIRAISTPKGLKELENYLQKNSK
jgi:AcrR family transcriptional regulator